MGFPNKGTSSVKAQNAKIDGLKAGLMAIERAMGRSITDIAKEYSVSTKTVKHYLSSEEASAYVDHYRKLAYDRLASKVMAVYESRLDLGDLEAARDLAFGLGILQKEAGKNQKIQVIETLDAYRKERESDTIRQRSLGATVLPPEGGGTPGRLQSHNPELPEAASGSRTEEERGDLEV